MKKLLRLAGKVVKEWWQTFSVKALATEALMVCVYIAIVAAIFIALGVKRADVTTGGIVMFAILIGAFESVAVYGNKIAEQYKDKKKIRTKSLLIETKGYEDCGEVVQELYEIKGNDRIELRNRVKRLILKTQDADIRMALEKMGWVSPERVKTIAELTEVQCSNGNWNYDRYMHGMANGMLFCVAVMKNEEVKYMCAPDKWICEKVESVAQSIATETGKKSWVRGVCGMIRGGE